MRVPFVALDRQYATLRDEVLEAVDAAFAHGQHLGGPEVAALESALAELSGTSSCALVASGTDALVLALRALGIGDGDRVAVPAFSFLASASAILHVGARPVFVDVGEDCLARRDQLCELIERRAVRAAIVVHLYGQLFPVEEILEIARRQGVSIVEDAAQSLGATREARPAELAGDAVCYSFSPLKVIGAHGNAGAVTSHDEAVVDAVRRYRYHGRSASGTFEELGWNSQADTVQAAVILTKLRHRREWESRRREVARRYDEVMSRVEWGSAVPTLDGNAHVHHKYVIRAPSCRAALRDHLARRHVETSVHYPTGLHRHEVFAGRSETSGDLLGAERAAGEVLSLPIYPELEPSEVDLVCAGLEAFESASVLPGRSRP